VVNGLVLAVFISTGGIIVTSIQGHAEAEDLARVEKEAKDTKTDLKEHLKEWQAEQVEQAAFRAALVERLNLKLKHRPEGRP
tara:strand:- start:508 stop:753 length:246 start_codon:yes stop_codon:yes gene_type:complete